MNSHYLDDEVRKKIEEIFYIWIFFHFISHNSINFDQFDMIYVEI